MQIVINYSISCTKLVVPLWRLTSNNFQYPLSFLYLHRFREKSPSLPPKKKHHQFGLLNNMLIVDLDQCDQKIYLPEKKMM